MCQRLTIRRISVNVFQDLTRNTCYPIPGIRPVKRKFSPQLLTHHVLRMTSPHPAAFYHANFPNPANPLRITFYVTASYVIRHGLAAWRKLASPMLRRET